MPILLIAIAKSIKTCLLDDASWRWRLSTRRTPYLTISRDSVKTCVADVSQKGNLPDLHLDTSTQECAVKMQQSSNIHRQSTEETVPVAVSSKSPKKAHDPLVHLLAGA